MSSTRGSKGDQDSYYSRTRRRERSRSRSDDESYSQRRRRDSDRDRHYESRRDHHGSGDYKSKTRRSRSRTRDRYKRNEDSGSRGHDRHYDRSRDRKSRSSSERSRTPSPISQSPQPSDKVSSTNVPDSGISIKLGPAPLPFKPAASTLSTSTPGVGSRTGISAPIVRSKTVASIFNDDDDEEEEEMPPEAKMKMKNVGRNTPTSAGPNSFGKTKIGFCNALHIAGREMEEKQLNNK